MHYYRMVPQDSGEYTCVATNQLNITKVYSSRSTAKVIKVKGQGSFVSHNYGVG
jgi:hypothetical protein